MSDLMLLGILRMPLDDTPEGLGVIAWTQIKSVMREAANRIEADAARIAALEATLREAYEVYAGSDGFIAETAAEGYLQQLISEMVAIIGAGLKK
jgi:hypothetical protein